MPPPQLPSFEPPEIPSLDDLANTVPDNQTFPTSVPSSSSTSSHPGPAPSETPPPGYLTDEGGFLARGGPRLPGG